MMPTVSVKADVTEAVIGLEELAKEVPNVRRYVLGVIGRAARDWVRARMGAFLGSHGGTFFVRGEKRKWMPLRQHVYGYARSAEHFVVAAPRYIAEPLERGATIRPKNGKKYLAFVGSDGNVRMVKSVTIPARRWFTRSIDGFEKSGGVSAAIKKAEERLAAKFEKRRAAK